MPVSVVRKARANSECRDGSTAKHICGRPTSSHLLLPAINTAFSDQATQLPLAHFHSPNFLQRNGQVTISRAQAKDPTKVSSHTVRVVAGKLAALTASAAQKGLVDKAWEESHPDDYKDAAEDFLCLL